MASKLSMKLHTLISLPNEPWLEKWARMFRYGKADTIITRLASTSTKNITLVDFGCGQDTLYRKYLRVKHPKLTKRLQYIGIDPLLQTTAIPDVHARLIKKRFEDVSLPQKADIVVMFAVLEHVDDAKELLTHAWNMLKPNGVVIATTPSPLARLPLEFLSHALGIISVREIEEHKRYPDKDYLFSLCRTLGPHSATHEYFELGLNNFFVLKKGSPAKDVSTYSIARDLNLAFKIFSGRF